MGIGAGLYMYDVVVKEFTFAISSPDEFLSRLSIHCCYRFYSATCPVWMCSIFDAEISAAVVECEIRVVHYRQVAPLCVINLITLESRHVVGRSRRL